MPDTETTTLILAVPGTQETRELDFASVRDAVARGEIGLDNWAWCPTQNNWLPLAQLPEFEPIYGNGQTYEEPKPAPEPEVQAAPVAFKVPRPAQVSVVTAVGTPNKMAATYYSKPMEESDEFPIFKVLFVVLGLLIGALVGVNYYLVDQPYQQNLSRTPFAAIQTHAHLGAFIQPNALLIHLRPNSKITPDNFADLLSTLTKCAPSQAFDGRPFASVALTSSWLSEYVFTAENWKGLADIGGLSPDQKRDFVLDRLETNVGESLVPHVRNESPDAHKAREAKIWNDLVAHFQPASS